MEYSPKQFEDKKSESEREREEKMKEYIDLAEKLSERGEPLKFFGINQVDYLKLKKGEEELRNSDRTPDIVQDILPIDALITKFQKEGIKVVFASNKKNGNVLIVSAEAKNGGDDIVNCSISPEKLQVDEKMDEQLKNLIALCKSLGW